LVEKLAKVANIEPTLVRVPRDVIATAGGIDTHIHFICPQQITEAISSGITTMIGGGTGPATGTNATTCSPGEWNIQRMLEAAEAFPVNLGFLVYFLSNIRQIGY